MARSRTARCALFRSQVDNVGLGYKSVNFSAEKSAPRRAGPCHGDEGGGGLVYQFANTTTSRQRGRYGETAGLQQPGTTPQGGPSAASHHSPLGFLFLDRLLSR